MTFTGAVSYSDSVTAVVNSISPAFGPSYGGTTITISGVGFGATNVVTIDGIDCAVQSFDSTTIVCLTGVRMSPPSEGNSFSIITDGNVANINTEPYLYVDRWSDANTWGGDAAPIDGDSVYVPRGMTLLVDQSTPLMFSIIVEGKIKFADESDMTVDAHYFIIMEGEFEAGTIENPYQHMLTFTLHGGYYDKQLPMFGNKVIGCRNCKFSMYGRERTPTWTELSATISPQDSSFTVIEPVDWEAGEKIAVASSTFDHYETEERIISSVSADGLTITVTEPFEFRHYAAIETYGAE